MERETLQRLVECASGRAEADLVLADCRVVNVFSGQIIHGDIALCSGYIAGVGSYKGKAVRNLGGKFVLPGLIDAHVHIESSLASPEQFASAVIPCGTVSVAADPHEISNVCGTEGISYMMRASSRTPLKVHMMLPSCVPATEFETSGAHLGLDELSSLMQSGSVLGLGEMMAYPQVVSGDKETLDKIFMARRWGKPVDGHSPGLTGKELTAYAAAGIVTDHECSTAEELRERIELGMYVLLREGSAAHDLARLLEGVDEHNAHRCMFCTDDRQPGDILRHGHIDNHLRIAVRQGLDPITAVRMATINAALCYGLKEQGAVAPGYCADLAVVDDLENFRMREVYIDGILRAEDGVMVEDIQTGDFSSVTDTMNIRYLEKASLQLHISRSRARVIQLQERSLVTRMVERTVRKDSRGYYLHDPASPLNKLVVAERHKNTGNIGVALVENYGISGGALAVSIAHDSHNIIAVGDSDRDIILAVNQVIRDRGGIAVCADGDIISTLPLPIAGIMSDRPIAEIRKKFEELEDAAREHLGINSGIEPVMTLTFLALPVIPDIKLTDKGLFDVLAFRHISS